MGSYALSESEYRLLSDIFGQYKQNFPRLRNQQPARRNTGGGGDDGTIWAIVIQRPEYNDPDKAKYIVQKAAIAKVAGNDEWSGDGTDIEIDRVIGYEGYDSAAEDIRNFSTWFEPGAIVRIVAREDIRTDSSGSVPEEKRQPSWLLAESINYGGDETRSSFRYNAETRNSQAVWV